MKIIHVDRPHQDSNTLVPQMIDGVTYYWTVVSEGAIVGETFQEWWKRKQKQIFNQGKSDFVEGIFLYDIQALITSKNESCIMIRYQWITKN